MAIALSSESPSPRRFSKKRISSGVKSLSPGFSTPVEHSLTSVAGGDRRVHARMLGDRSRAFVYCSRCRRCVAVPVRRTPEHIRSDNGLEFVSKVICRWLKQADVKKLLSPRAAFGRTAMSNRSMARFAASC